MKMKARRSDPAPSKPVDFGLKKLQEYGERFLSMFDDAPKNKMSKATTSGSGGMPSVRSAATTHVAAGTETDTQSRRSKDVSPAANQSRPPSKGKTKFADPFLTGQPSTTAAQGASLSSPGDHHAAGRHRKRQFTSGGDEIDAIMRMCKASKRSRTKTHEEGGAAARADGQVAAGAAAARQQQQQQAAVAEALRRERRLFMSPKASKVHEAASPEPPRVQRRGSGAAGPASEGDEAGLSPEELRKLHLEIEKFASAALDRKSAKQYRARVLERIGAKAEKAPRTAASIGKGVAKMAIRRQAQALEEAIDTGMVQRKGLGKKKRALKAKNRDRGLMEAGPSFKNGILRVKPLKKPKAESGKLRLPKGVL